jgi:hypothetical protein
MSTSLHVKLTQQVVTIYLRHVGCGKTVRDFNFVPTHTKKMDIFALQSKWLESKRSDHEYQVQLTAATINICAYSSKC